MHTIYMYIHDQPCKIRLCRHRLSATHGQHQQLLQQLAAAAVDASMLTRSLLSCSPAFSRSIASRFCSFTDLITVFYTSASSDGCCATNPNLQTSSE